jgi:hypothetical protein
VLRYQRSGRRSAVDVVDALALGSGDRIQLESVTIEVAEANRATISSVRLQRIGSETPFLVGHPGLGAW